MPPDASLRAELAPTGTLRAAIYTGNFLLVSGQAANGDPTGVSPDVAAEIARRLGTPLALLPYPDPSLLVEAIGHWDIANIGAEPQRARSITFSNAYCEIESTYLVPPGSRIRTINEVDRPGIRIATKGLAAYGLWLENNLKQAKLVQTATVDGSFDVFVEQGLDALAGIRPRLLTDLARMPGARILDGQFSAVQQAVGTPIDRKASAAWIAEVIEDLKASGFVAEAITKHKITGLSVAALA